MAAESSVAVDEDAEMEGAEMVEGLADWPAALGGLGARMRERLGRFWDGPSATSVGGCTAADALRFFQSRRPGGGRRSPVSAAVRSHWHSWHWSMGCFRRLVSSILNQKSSRYVPVATVR